VRGMKVKFNRSNTIIMNLLLKATVCKRDEGNIWRGWRWKLFAFYKIPLFFQLHEQSENFTYVIFAICCCWWNFYTTLREIFWFLKRLLTFFWNSNFNVFFKFKTLTVFWVFIFLSYNKFLRFKYLSKILKSSKKII
jgi:hypothetical protein